MRDLKKQYQKEFSNIKPTSIQREKLLNNILMSKGKDNYYLKFGVVISTVLILCFFGITNATAIKETFNALRFNYFEKTDEYGNEYRELVTKYDGVIELNYDADLPEIESWIQAAETGLNMEYSSYDINILLGVKLLNNSLFSNRYYTFNTIKKNGDEKITYASLFAAYNSYEDENLDDIKIKEHIMMSCQFKTKYYENGNDFDLNIKDYYSVKNYYMEKLDTSALIIKLSESGRHYLVIFSHNNIRYKFYYDYYNQSVREEDILKRIRKILDSFEY